MAEKNPDLHSEKIPFEDALNQAGYGLYSHILTCMAGLAVISFVCIVYASTIIVPTSACELNTTVSQQGLIAAGPIIGSILGGILWGFLADTRGRRKMLLVALTGGAIFNLIAAISVNWIMLVTFQIIASLFASGLYSMCMSLLSESVPLVNRNLVVLLVYCISLLSQGLMAVLAIPIIPLSFSYYIPALDIYWNSWRTVLVIYSIPSIITIIWLFFMNESPKFVYVKGDEAKAIEILKSIHKINHWRSKEKIELKSLVMENESSGSQTSSAKDQIVPLFKMPLLKYTIIMFTLFVLQQVGAFVVWWPTIADQFIRILQNGGDTNLTMCDIIGLEAPVDVNATPCALNEFALLMVLAVAALQSIFNIFISVIVNKVGRRNIVLVLTALCGVSGILVNLVPNAIGSAVFFVLLTMGILVVGLYTAIIVALFPTNLRALAIAFAMTGGRIGTFASIQILNLMLANNCDGGFYLFSSLFAASAIIASFLPDDRRLQKPAPPETKEVQAQNNDGVTRRESDYLPSRL